MATLWCNGEWQESDTPAVSWSDRGLLHGLGLFETLLAVDGDPKHVDRHLARLAKGLSRLSWALPDFDLKSAMIELLDRNGLKEGRARVRLAVTGGSGPLNELAAGADSKVWISASPLAEAKDGCSLGLGLWQRNEHSPLVGLKCASYAENLVALDWAREQGHDEVLFLNTRGNLCEAATANLFLVLNDTLYTPSLDSGCLPGVTRELVIELAKEAGITVREDSLQLDDLQRADESFLTSSTRGVVPVTQFEGRVLKAGSLTTRLAALWQDSLTPR